MTRTAIRLGLDVALLLTLKVHPLLRLAGASGLAYRARSVLLRALLTIRRMI